VLPWAELSEALGRVEPSFAELDDDTRWLLVESFLGLVSAARVDDHGTQRPFLALRVQLWVRELRRLMRAVRPEVGPPAERYAFAWHDVLAEDDRQAWLPMARCWDCGSAGWATFLPEGSEVVSANAAEVGRAWLKRRPSARFLVPGSTPRRAGAR
jgi:DEAD/DEAH box helicase domain-containing protein